MEAFPGESRSTVPAQQVGAPTVVTWAFVAFPEAATTKGHTLGGFKDRNVLSHKLEV